MWGLRHLRVKGIADAHRVFQNREVRVSVVIILALGRRVESKVSLGLHHRRTGRPPPLDTVPRQVQRALVEISLLIVAAWAVG